MEQYIEKDEPIYIYGNSGVGKTKMIRDYFEQHEHYDVYYLSIQQLNSLK